MAHPPPAPSPICGQLRSPQPHFLSCPPRTALSAGRRYLPGGPDFRGSLGVQRRVERVGARLLPGLLWRQGRDPVDDQASRECAAQHCQQQRVPARQALQARPPQGEPRWRCERPAAGRPLCCMGGTPRESVGPGRMPTTGPSSRPSIGCQVSGLGPESPCFSLKSFSARTARTGKHV